MQQFPRLIGLVLLVVAFLLVGVAPAAPLQQTGKELTIGSSGQNRPITAVQFGDGPHKLVVVGDTHGGPEANTYELTTRLIAYFRANPDVVPASVRLYLVPTLNPDGLALGSRFNARGVDLNRNMNTTFDSCADNDWNPTVQGAYGVVSNTGGPYADSEVESRVIRSFLLDAQGAIFIHSNAGLVFPASCEQQPSIVMAQAYASGAAYEYSRFWPNYTITGGMHDWAGSLGIAAITPELITGDLPEFEQNLGGLLAVLSQADAVLLSPQDRIEAGIAMPETIWRYWKAYGGVERFGMPLAAPSETDGVISQQFVNATLELRPAQADTPALVQPALLGRESMPAPLPPTSDNGSGRYFAQTGHNLFGAILDAWQRADGAAVYGLPISEEAEVTASDGQRRPGQYFERAVLVYYAEDNSVRPEPLGWAALMREQLTAPEHAYQLR